MDRAQGMWDVAQLFRAAQSLEGNQKLLLDLRFIARIPISIVLEQTQDEEIQLESISATGFCQNEIPAGFLHLPPALKPWI